MARTGAEQVLVDPDLDERLSRSGIVGIPMVDPEELTVVEKAYWELVPADEDGIRLDYLRPDRALARSLAELMTPLWERVVPEVFECHYPVYSSFVVKHPGSDSSMFLHRDLYVDDERKRRTFAMWMPFEDTDPDLGNGPLSFVFGSEGIQQGSFGPNWVLLSGPYYDHLRARLQPVSVPAGTSLVYDARLLHASEPNRTDHPRLAVGCLLARRDQPVIQVMATGRRHRVVHEVDRDYFVDQAPSQIALDGMPDRYPILEEYDEEPAVTAEDLLDPCFDPANAVREVIVPADLSELAGSRRSLPVGSRRRPRHRHDLALKSADLAPVGPRVAGSVRTETTGGVGSVDLCVAWRRVQPTPGAVPDLIVRLAPPWTRDATLAVVDPGGRLALTAVAHPIRRHEVVVIECSPVVAGACTTDHVAELDLGRSVALDPGQPLHLWNQGPGPLVVLVRSAPALRRRAWSRST